MPWGTPCSNRSQSHSRIRPDRRARFHGVKSPWHPPTRTSSSPTVAATRSIASVSRSRVVGSVSDAAACTQRCHIGVSTSARRPSSNAAGDLVGGDLGDRPAAAPPPWPGTERRHHEHLHPTPGAMARAAAAVRPGPTPARRPAPSARASPRTWPAATAESPIFANAQRVPRTVEHSQHGLAVRPRGADAQADRDRLAHHVGEHGDDVVVPRLDDTDAITQRDGTHPERALRRDLGARGPHGPTPPR